MKKKFNSKDWTFRPTSLGAAMQKAGLIDTPSLVREAKQEGLLRAKTDKENIEPSVHIVPLAA